MNINYQGKKIISEFTINNFQKVVAITLPLKEYSYGFEEIGENNVIFLINQEYLDVYKNNKYISKLKFIIDVKQEIKTNLNNYKLKNGVYEVLEIIFQDIKIGVIIKPRISKSNTALDSSTPEDLFDIGELIGDIIGGIGDAISSF